MIRNKQYSTEQLSQLAGTAHRLQRQLNEVFTPEFALEVRVADSWPVQIPQELQRKYDIGPYGRKAINGDKIVIHAAPTFKPYPLQYQSVDTNMIQDALHYASHGYASFNQDPVQKMVPVEKMSAGPIVMYERELISRFPSPVVLVNPSGSTIWACENLNVVIQCEESQREHVERQYEAMGRPVPWVTTNTSRLIHYLGSHGVRTPPCRRTWYALTPNCQYVPVYQNWQVKEVDDGFRVVYTTKTRHDYIIPNIPIAHRLSAQSTDIFLGTDRKMFFLESNAPLSLSRSQKVFFGSHFLRSPLPPLQPDGTRQDEQYVWDVPGSGTYYSRREKIAIFAASVGKVSVPLLLEGDIPIAIQTEELAPMTYHRTSRGWSLVPISSHGEVQGGFNGCLITRNPQYKPLSACPGLYYTQVKCDPDNGILDTIESDYFFLRSISEVGSRLPLILKLLSNDSSIYLPKGKGPPQHWSDVQTVLDSSIEKGYTLGRIVQVSGIASSVIGIFVSRVNNYLFYSPSMKSIMTKLRKSGDIPQNYRYGKKLRELQGYIPGEPPYERAVAHSSDVFEFHWYQAFRDGIEVETTPEQMICLCMTFQNYRVTGPGTVVSAQTYQ